MSRKTIGEDILNQLDESPIDMLTTPISKNGEMVHSSKNEALKPIQKKKVKKTFQFNNSVVSEKLLREKERMTVQISKLTIERVKNAVYWERMTIAQFVEEALKVALSKLEKQRGEPYQKRKSELKPGRPIK